MIKKKHLYINIVTGSPQFIYELRTKIGRKFETEVKAALAFPDKLLLLCFMIKYLVNVLVFNDDEVIINKLGTKFNEHFKQTVFL